MTIIGCRDKSDIEIQSATTISRIDSAKVQRLLLKGDSVYSVRNNISDIGQSLLYFDSAHKLAEKLDDTLLLANTLYHIGNVYNAWNGEPATTLDYYQKSTDLYATIPEQWGKYFYLRYNIAHGYDKEKADDSSRSAQVIISAMNELYEMPKLRRDSLNFMTDFAWVATNIANYKLADDILKGLDYYPANDPESNNYLDHYYLTRARIDIHYGKNSPYLDSLNIALSNCTNAFDSGYYANNLSLLYAKMGEYRKAYDFTIISNLVTIRTTKSDILSVLRNQLLNAELRVQKEKEKRKIEEEKTRAFFLFALIVIGILVATIILIYRKRKAVQNKVRQQHQFTLDMLQKTEDTQRSIAMELHDGVNHELLSLKNNIFLGKEVLSGDVEGIINSIRHVSHNLYPAFFEAAGLVASLEVLCNKTTETGCYTTCILEYEERLKTSDELQLYRLIQEALQNVVKHANAEACKITLITGQGRIFLEIKDNGRGIKNLTENNNSFGLETMRQRALALNAKLLINSSPQGTVITITKL